MAVTTLGTLGRSQIEALCAALRIPDQAHRALSTFDLLSGTWGHRAVHEPPVPSDITDDSSPYEFSVAFDGHGPELRVLVEAQHAASGAGDAREQWDAGWKLSEQLAAAYGVSLARARRVAPLFEPASEGGLLFGLWHASSFKPSSPGFRTYFNPQAQGPARAMAQVLAALDELGLGGAGVWLRAHVASATVAPIYFSVDLSEGAGARCKVYLAHPTATAEELEQLVAGYGGHAPGDTRAFVEAMTGAPGPYASRPPLVCLAFREGSDLPYTITLHVPIRCYAESDLVALGRIASQLSAEEAASYARAIGKLARRPLESSTGIQTYASLRREDGRKRMTIYLSPEAYTARSE